MIDPAVLTTVSTIVGIALKRAKGSNRTEITESELITITKSVIVGDVHITQGVAAPGVDDRFVTMVVAECFNLMMTQPGLEISFIWGADERSITIKNPATFMPPEPAALEDAAKTITETTASLPQRPRTAADYAMLDREALEQPDND